MSTEYVPEKLSEKMQAQKACSAKSHKDMVSATYCSGKKVLLQHHALSYVGVTREVLTEPVSFYL